MKFDENVMRLSDPVRLLCIFNDSCMCVSVNQNLITMQKYFSTVKLVNEVTKVNVVTRLVLNN